MTHKGESVPKGKRRRRGKSPANKGKQLPSERLTVDEVHRLLRACSRRSATGIRLAAMLALGWRAGLRAAEVLSLRPGDLDSERGMVRVLRPKGGPKRARTVGVAPDCLPYLDRWLDVRRRLGVGPTAPLFCGIRGPGRGHPMATAYLRQALPRLGRRAGITKRCHFHALRTTMATELAESGAPLHAISSQLGHASVATTDRYIRKVAPVALAGMMAEHSRKQNGETKPAAGQLSEADVKRIAEALAALTKR